MRTLWRVVAPNFCAGVVTEGFIVKKAAPILRWSIGQHINKLMRPGWTVQAIRKEQ